MRIPLDYYRILGLPIQATADQLKQAHRDRTLQLPRREYSEVAIEARKGLIDEAYEVLSDPNQRQTYDRQFLAKAYSVDVTLGEVTPDSGQTDAGEAALRSLAADPSPSEAPTPTIEITPGQLVGALLILLELGEYELVIRLGRPYLSSGSGALGKEAGKAPQRVLGDIVLTLALACLELGREQWQQRQYENAAESLETGQELLLRENVFPSIRAELQGDLYKLRPYRVLELVARPLEQTTERRQGIKLLKAMLQDRGGIDGAEDDLSGLSTDDFLRFIQQLRGYLSAGEQQEIFEAEARRPSAVAIYLAVYALLARGFAFHQPALVRRAKQLLGRVSTQQDVYLEQAVCALLLGQTEEASRALELSQEYEPLAFIREHSQGAPDRLPGLCLYGERWLREEVFPHFRDLAPQQTGLKDYFADPQVQAYLEAIPATADASMGVTDPRRAPSSSASRASGEAIPAPAAPQPIAMAGQIGSTVPWSAPPQSQRISPLPSRPEEVVENGPTIAERVSQLSPEGQLSGSNGRRDPGPPPPPIPISPGQRPRPRTTSPSPRWGRLAGVATLGIVGVGLLGFATMRTLGWVTAALSGPRLERPALDVGLAAPPIEIPPIPEPEPEIGVQSIAERTVNNWLAAKREALGKDHNIDSLATILVDPVLTQWQNRAEGGDRENWYWEYDHSIEVLKVEPDDPTAETLAVDVRVREAAQFYEFGVRNTANSYDDTLTMRYDLIRQDGEWFVRGMRKL
ncbi:IMS domain-containing protein [Leptolyngbya sp. PCC 6406]|uniref:IMS domain-containing protein n=1 Tax=Leptolyngbya sp. PCC 6406 TaxID=1173264 RepID=UPI0002ACF227|nr:IMS domain-containing protein [Leptolyngbya sp. PCC 6406]